MNYPKELIDIIIIIVMVLLFSKVFTDLNHKKNN